MDFQVESGWSCGGVVISQKAADMYFASATARTGYVARGIAGKEAASCVHSHQTAASDILWKSLNITNIRDFKIN